MSLATFIKYAQLMGLKAKLALTDLLQSGATYGQFPVWTGGSWIAQTPVEDLTVERSAKDANNIFTSIQYKRADGTLYKQSVLSGGTSPAYTTRTLTFYAPDGVTVQNTKVYLLVYSGSDLVSETLQP